MTGTVAFAMSKKYTNDSMDGAGAVKGVPCTISAIDPITDTGGDVIGKRVIFQWTSNSGTVTTTPMDVMYGEDGRGIASVEVDAAGNLVITYDDGAKETRPITLSVASLEFVDSLPASGQDSVIYLVPTGTENVCSMYIWSNGQWKLVGSTQIDMSQYYTKTQTDALLDGKIDLTEKGAASGVAELDATGKVPSSQLPSYVDDTIEGYLNDVDGKFYADSAYTTEIPGETGKIYVTLDTELTYRWSGSIFVEISESLALGETSSTAYAGNKGKKNADDIAELNTLTGKLAANTAPQESGTTSSAAYAEEDLLLLDGVLYKAKTAIAVGDTFTVGTNIETTTLNNAIQEGGGGAVHEEMTYAQYQALTPAQKRDGTIRFVPDAPSGGGGSGELTADLPVTETVGGVTSGTTYLQGTPLEDIFKDMLNPVKYPSFTAPSASITATGAKLLEVGGTLATIMTITFSRGAISPAYGTSGFRSGEATGYSLNGGTAQSGNTFSVTVTEAQKTYQGTVNYAAGEQPKDSTGADYDSPLPAGSVNSNTITYEFVNALWANMANIGTVAKLSLVSKSAKQRDMVFPAQSVTFPETFDVPASWTVTAVQVKNDLSGAYEDALSQFTVTDVNHDDAGGTSTAYKRYTFNMGMATGSRTVRLKWN